MSLERTITDSYRKPPLMFGEQLSKHVSRLERLRLILKQSSFLSQHEVQTVIDMLNNNGFTDPTLPEIASAATEYQLSTVLDFTQDINWSLDLLIANKSALRGAISLLNEIFTIAQEAKFPSGLTIPDEKREYLRLLEADPTGAELALQLKHIYRESYFYRTPNSILNIPCLVVGSSMASDLYTAFANNHRKSFGI